jgi:signal transduction histidine kinase
MQVHMEESGEKPELICKMLDALGAHLSIAISRFRSLVKLNEANDVILSQAKFAIANEVSGTLMHQLKTDIMAFREMVDGMMEDKRLRGHPAVFQVLQKLQKDARGWSAKVAAPLAFIVDTDDTVVCSAAETVAEAVTQWYDTADARGCRLKMFPCRSTIHVHIKPSHLKEVVSCLIVNALQAHARVIEVGIEREHPSPEQGAHAVLTVEDDGVGVPASVAQDMFRLGYTTKKKRGTGIGLFIVERLANAMSGQVWLAAGGRAQGKRRTVFKVSIPEDSGEQA